MKATHRLVSGAKFGLVMGLFTMIPVGKLKGKPLALTCAGLGLGVGGLAGVGVARKEFGARREAGAPTEADSGSLPARLCVATVAGAATGAGLWLTCTIDRHEENWLRKRGVRHPRPWMALAAAVIGGVAETLDASEPAAETAGGGEAREAGACDW